KVSRDLTGNRLREVLVRGSQREKGPDEEVQGDGLIRRLDFGDSALTRVQQLGKLDLSQALLLPKVAHGIAEVVAPVAPFAPLRTPGSLPTPLRYCVPLRGHCGIIAGANSRLRSPNMRQIPRWMVLWKRHGCSRGLPQTRTLFTNSRRMQR